MGAMIKDLRSPSGALERKSDRSSGVRVSNWLTVFIIDVQIAFADRPTELIPAERATSIAFTMAWYGVPSFVAGDRDRHLLLLFQRLELIGQIRRGNQLVLIMHLAVLAHRDGHIDRVETSGCG